VIDTNLKVVFFLCQAAAKQATWSRKAAARSSTSPDADLPGRHPRAELHGVQVGPRRADQAAGQRMGGQGHQRQRHRARLYRDQQHRGPAGGRDRNASILERIPAGRWGRPEDLGGAAVFLASQASDYVQGHILAVDGGWLAR
jgi:2-deoxy-D-gluconate 3-dehydrogenase